MQETADINILSAIDYFNKLWPIIIFIMGIVWKQIITHFDVINLKETCSEQRKKVSELENKNDLLEKDFHDALKSHILENKASFDKLTEAVTELIKTTTTIAVKIELSERQRQS